MFTIELKKHKNMKRVLTEIRLYMILNIFSNAFHYNKNINNNINCRLMSHTKY